ncbi:hypothetical protein PYCC9005_000580 [Savitreella phatthalungensis]
MRSIVRAPVRTICKTEKIDAATLLGPREIYDAAHSRERVLGLSYDDLLNIVSEADPAEHGNAAASDLFIASKIMRRAPKLANPTLARERLEVARRLTRAAALRGDTAAELFWCEEVLRSPKSAASIRKMAMENLSRLAAAGEGKASLLMANELYSLGKKKAALRAYRSAGERGVGEAYTKLGRILRKDGHDRLSRDAFERAANLGEPNADFMLSVLAAVDVAAAERKADQSSAERCRNIQLKHLRQAARGGVVEAQYNLGDLYRRGGQVELAKEFLEAAAKRGFQPAQSNLAALLIAQGRRDQARAWLREAQRGGGEIAEHAARTLASIEGAPESPTKTDTSCTIM